ncbi:hypothetical protein GMAR_ORF106 [Golden Marseillevirus]|uniref:hypothetical protein n=1 Tax=Golden Marseillevirus TaxID=1720526 RepID=UPI000877AD27|nr:hypothetical protein GMAR_ORF106 [Golden Marseillevirus]ALX27480.1 hypothetical protein GMAR_ORF106 [Golden Marseillevirus]
MNNFSLEDLPDEVLFDILENVDRPEVSLTNERISGIWREANSLKSLILRKNKRAADEKYSDKFTEEHIRLCLETGFLYPLEKNFYERWVFTVDRQDYNPSFILFGKVLGEMQILPEVTDPDTGEYKGDRIVDFTKLFGWPKPNESHAGMEHDYGTKYDEVICNISFGLGAKFARLQKEGKSMSFKGAEPYLGDAWFLVGYISERVDEKICWNTDIPKEFQREFTRALKDGWCAPDQYEVTLYVLLQLKNCILNLNSLTDFYAKCGIRRKEIYEFTGGRVDPKEFEETLHKKVLSKGIEWSYQTFEQENMLRLSVLAPKLRVEEWPELDVRSRQKKQVQYRYENNYSSGYSDSEDCDGKERKNYRYSDSESQGTSDSDDWGTDSESESEDDRSDYY